MIGLALVALISKFALTVNLMSGLLKPLEDFKPSVKKEKKYCMTRFRFRGVAV